MPDFFDRNLLLILGVAMIVLGISALSQNGPTSFHGVGVMEWVGWIFLAGGLLVIIAEVKRRSAIRKK